MGLYKVGGEEGGMEALGTQYPTLETDKTPFAGPPTVLVSCAITYSVLRTPYRTQFCFVLRTTYLPLSITQYGWVRF
jgi:hypothetical protein